MFYNYKGRQVSTSKLIVYYKLFPQEGFAFLLTFYNFIMGGHNLISVADPGLDLTGDVERCFEHVSFKTMFKMNRERIERNKSKFSVLGIQIIGPRPLGAARAGPPIR